MNLCRHIDRPDIPRENILLGSFLQRRRCVQAGRNLAAANAPAWPLKTLMHPVNLLILDEPTKPLGHRGEEGALQAIRVRRNPDLRRHDAYVIQEAATSILYLTEENPPSSSRGLVLFQLSPGAEGRRFRRKRRKRKSPPAPTAKRDRSTTVWSPSPPGGRVSPHSRRD